MMVEPTSTPLQKIQASAAEFQQLLETDASVDLATRATFATLLQQLQHLRDGNAQQMNHGESEEKYRTLFNSIDEGVTIVELIFDQNNHAVNAIYLETNPGMTRLTGLSSDIIGKQVSEFSPNLEPFWLQIYERIIKTGHSERFEYASDDLDRWFDVYASRIGGEGSRKLVAVYTNITERKRRESNLAFLAEVSQDLGRLTNVDETMNTLGAKLAAYLDLSACAFAELSEGAQFAVINHGWHRSDVPSLLGIYRMEDFMTAEVLRRCLAGEAVIIRDVFDDPLIYGEQYAALNIGSFVSMPLVRGGEWRFLLVVYRSESYNWRDDEIELIRELTARIWIRLERARAEEALQESEAKYRTLFNSIDEGFCIFELQFDGNGNAVDWIYLVANPAFEQQTGYLNPVGRRISEFQPDLERSWFDRFAEVARMGEPVRFIQYTDAMGIWYDVYALRVGGARDNRISLLFTDITARKRAEANRDFLAEITEDLSRLSSADEMMQTVGTKVCAYLNLSSCIFVEVDEARDTATVHATWNGQVTPILTQATPLSTDGNEGLHRLSRVGKVIVSPNTQTDPRLDPAHYAAFNLYAFISAPFLRNGVWHFTLTATDDHPREWRTDELELLQELANRIFPRIERARAEAALRASEERFRLFVTTSSDIVYRMSPDWSQMLYLEGKEFLASVQDPTSTWLESYILPEDRPRVQAAIRQAIQSKSIFEMEHHVIQADGSIGWTSSRAMPLLNSGDEIIEWFGTASDITERVRAEDALQESEAKYRTLFESMDEAFCIIEVLFDHHQQPIDYMFLATNPAFERQTGLKEVIGKHARELMPLLEDYWVQIYGEVALTGQPIRFENYTAQFQRFFEVYAFRIGDPSQHRVATLFNDISLRKQLETSEQEQVKRDAVLQERQRLARELHDAVTQSLYSASVIAESLPRLWLEVPDPIRDKLNLLQTLSRGALAEMRVLLLELRPEYLANMNLEAQLQQLLAALKARKNVDTSLVVKGKTRPLPAAINIAFYRIAQEALNNIIKYARATQVTITLNIQLRKLRLVIQDDGTGFDTLEPSSGFGLKGMAERADEIGAVLKIISRPKSGTRVSLTWRTGIEKE
jgi:PAS domain S-box-containing protein